MIEFILLIDDSESDNFINGKIIRQQKVLSFSGVLKNSESGEEAMEVLNELYNNGLNFPETVHYRH